MSILQIGKAIFKLLSDISPNKVFPCVAEQGTTYPFIVYRRYSANADNTKDRYNYFETGMVEIMVADASYNGSVELADKVKERLEKVRGQVADFNINGIVLYSADESFVDDAYIQKLTFQVEIQK